MLVYMVIEVLFARSVNDINWITFKIQCYTIYSNQLECENLNPTIFFYRLVLSSNHWKNDKY